MADTTDFRNGFTMSLDGEIFSIVEFQHVKPGKGSAFVRTKLKNTKTGAVLDRTFRSGDKVEQVRLEKRQMQYLYTDQDLYYFMDLDTYDQIPVSAEIVGAASNLLKESENAFLLVAGEEIVSVELPNFVSLGRHAHRTGRQGRHRHRRGQASYPRDRLRGTSAALCQQGRPAQGRYPHWRIRRARLRKDDTSCERRQAPQTARAFSRQRPRRDRGPTQLLARHAHPPDPQSCAFTSGPRCTHAHCARRASAYRVHRTH